jgi:hypothetical protein
VLGWLVHQKFQFFERERPKPLTTLVNDCLKLPLPRCRRKEHEDIFTTNCCYQAIALVDPMSEMGISRQ